jgi:hypothetical protein
MSNAMETVGGWTGRSKTMTGQPSRELLGWIQSIHLENMDELFGNALADFGEDEVRSHLAELADWTAAEVARRVAWDQIEAFLGMAGSNWNLKWLRQQAQENPSWGEILDCVMVEAPECYFEELLPAWGQSAEGVGSTPGSGTSR